MDRVKLKAAWKRKTEVWNKNEIKKFTTIIFYIVHIDWNKIVVMQRTRTEQTIQNQIHIC